MTYLPKVCNKKRASFLRQLVAISGWKGCLLLMIGTIGAAVNGYILVYRVTMTTAPLNKYIGWVLTKKLLTMNISDDFDIDNYMYAGIGITTLDQVLEATNSSAHYFFAMGAITLVAGLIQIFSWDHVNAVNVEKLRGMFFTQALRLDLTWHDRLKKDSDLNTRLSVDLQRVKNNLGSKTSLLIYSLASILATFVVVFQVHWVYGVINVIGVIVTTTFTLISGKFLIKQVRKEQANDRSVGYTATEVLTTFKTVKSFGRENDEVNKFSRLLQVGRGHSKIKHIICSIHSAFNIFALYALVTVFLCFGSRLVDEKFLDPGDYAIGFFCTVLSSLASGNLVPIISDVMEAANSFSNLLSIMEFRTEIDPSSSDGHRPQNLRSDIFFEGVTYSYPSRKTFKVLNGLNLEIPQGKCVALVGPSGSGKSTVIDLVLRLFDPDSGKVTIGGTDIRTINVNHLRKRIGVVMQEPVLFDTTIEENIRYGNLTASAADIQRAAKLANADDFIMKLPLGYKTMVGERGSNLSGGQKQRVAIARALVSDPDILLLDEATSALDSDSETVVQEALERAMKGRTTIVVAHRLSTISQADFIYLLKDGVVHESGTHSELVLESGIYCAMQTRENEKEHGRRPKNNENNSLETKNLFRNIALNDIHEQPEETVFKINTEKVFVDRVPKTQVFKLFLQWKSVISFFFSVVSGWHCPIFCLIYLYRSLQAFENPLHEGSADLLANGLNMIYFDIGFAILFFIAILSASIAMEDSIEYLRLGMFRKVLGKEMHFFDRTQSKTTHLANSIIQKPGQLKDIAGPKASGALSGVTLILTAIIVSFVKFWQLTLVQCAFFVFVLVLSWFQITRKIDHQKSVNARLKKGSKVSSFI